MYNTVRDPGMAKGFGILANILGQQDATGAIKADLYKGQRDEMRAATALKQQELVDMRNAEAYRAMLSEVLTDPNWMNTPEGRANATSMLPYMEDGMQHGPGFLTGTSVFTQPDHLAPGPLSNVLIGTGVVDDWGKTPVGHQYETDVRAATDLATGGGSRTPLDVGPNDVGALQAMLTHRLQAQNPEGLPIDPAFLAEIMPVITRAYQQSRDAELAVSQALEGVEMERYQDTGVPFWPFDNQDPVLRRKAGSPAPAPAQPPAAGAPAGAGGAPAPASAGALPPPESRPEGLRARTHDGREVVWTNGQWMPVR